MILRRYTPEELKELQKDRTDPRWALEKANKVTSGDVAHVG